MKKILFVFLFLSPLIIGQTGRSVFPSALKDSVKSVVSDTATTLRASIATKLTASDTSSLSNRIDTKLTASDTSSLSNRIDLKYNTADTTAFAGKAYMSAVINDSLQNADSIKTRALEIVDGTATVSIDPNNNHGIQIARPNDDVGMKIKVNNEKTGWIQFTDEDGAGVAEIEYDTYLNTFEFGSNEANVQLRAAGTNTVTITDSNMTVDGYIQADSIQVGSSSVKIGSSDVVISGTSVAISQSSQDALINSLLARIQALEDVIGDTTGLAIPNAPSNPTLNAGVHVLVLGWTDNSTNETGFEIQRDTLGGVTWASIDTADADAIVYRDSTDNGIIAGGSYKYRARALGSSGNSGWLDFGSGTVLNTEYLLAFNPTSPSYDMDSTSSESEGFFVADAEENNTSEFTSTTVTGSNSFVASTDEIHGTYGFKATKVDANTAYATYNFALKDSLYARFYLLMPDSVILNNTAGIELFAFRQNTTVLFRGSVTLQSTSANIGANDLRYGANSISGFDYTDTNLVELFYQRNISGTGNIKMWVNGVEKLNFTHATVDTHQVNSIQLGVVSAGTRITGTSSIIFDDIILSDSPIGAYSSTGADSTVSVYFVNTSGANIEVTTLTFDDDAIFSTSQAVPFTINNDDSVSVDFVVDRNQSEGTYSSNLQITHAYGIQNLGFSVDITGAGYTPPASDPSNTWWVASGGLGSQTGTDSANAWSLASINYSSIQPGDTVLFIQGTYGTFAPTKSGTSGNVVTYMANPNNSDSVWFVGSDKAIRLANLSYVRIKGLNVRNSGTGLELRPPLNNIFVDSSYYKKNIYAIFSVGNWSPTLHPSTAQMDSIWFRWNNIQVDSQVTTQTDGISMYGGCNNWYIIGNIIEQRNLIGDGHNDCIQMSNGVGDVVYANNKFVNYKTSSSQLFMNGSPFAGYKMILYNNLFEVYGSGVGVAIEGAVENSARATDAGQVWVYNNTFYNNINNSHIHKTDTVYAKNNIFTTYNPSGSVAMWFPPSTLGVYDLNNFDYNVYHTNGSSFPVYLDTQGAKTLAQWRAAPYNADANGMIADPLFVSIASKDYQLQAGSPAKNAGTNLQSIIEGLNITDPLGIVSGYLVGWKTFTNPYITGATGTTRDATPDCGAW